MAAVAGIDPSGWLEYQLATASPDLLRTMVKTFAEAVMSVQDDQRCGAEYGTRSPDRVDSRNGYRTPGVGYLRQQHRAGDPETPVRLLLPGVAPAASAPGRAGLATVVATSYLLGLSTRRVEKLAEQLR